MSHESPGAGELISRRFQREHRGLKCHPPAVCPRHGIEFFFGSRECFRDICLDMFGRKLGPTDVKILVEKRV